MVNYFIGFDKLLGKQLITILYYLGLVGIAFGFLAGILGGLGMMFGVSFFGGVGAVIATIIGTAIGVLLWRFICELYVLFFRMAEDLRDLRNAKLPSAPPAETI
jgi:hypothetical protein